MIKYKERLTILSIILLTSLSVLILNKSEVQAKNEYKFSDNPRIKYSINENWKFYPGGLSFGQRDQYRKIKQRIDDNWETISLPHTWNAFDPFDDVESYRRGISWYRKEIKLNDNLEGKRIYLYFEGVNQIADVYVNGAFVACHKGGYTAFVVDITGYVKFDGNENRNLIAVQVDNSHNNDVPPLSVGYALYGGIYRDVWLISTNQVHVKVTDYASSGIYISTPKVTEVESIVKIQGTIVNSSENDRYVRIVNSIVDAENNMVKKVESNLSLEANSEGTFEHTQVSVNNPRLWSPDDPYLYSVYTEIYIGNKLEDRIKNPLGFRWFSFNQDSGFSLNSKEVQIKGTNRHQDYQGLGSALPNSQHVKDLEWIKNMGANFVRLAHYPQDPVVLETCDRLGLLVWEEVPLVNYINTSKEFLENSKAMIKEMIRQHYNHPSVIIWGSTNEIFLWDEKGDRVSTINNSNYMKEVHDFVFSLDSLIRIEDSSRYTAMAFHSSKDYEKVGIDTIPQIQAWNVYHGWYGGRVDQFGKWLDRRHTENPNSLIFISEYGAGSDVRINGVNSKRFDFSGNWQRRYHESHIRRINERPYLAGTAIWNQFDFSQPHTGGSIPHLNQKGMQTWDRKQKDVYFLYNANWNNEPMVYIASRDWKHRFGAEFNDSSDIKEIEEKQPVDIYSNLVNVELLCNGKSLGIRQPDKIKKISWQVKLKPGKNIIEARGYEGDKLYQDLLILEYSSLPDQLEDAFTNLNELAINVGFNATFVDESRLVWLPDQHYQVGSYGCIGGKSEMVKKDFIILHSGKNTPIYNYYQSDIESYRLNVPDGDYEVELCFAEPEDLEINERVFSISINKELVLKKLDLVKEYGFIKAVSKCFVITTSNGSGIDITFEKIYGKPILNALRVKKI